MPKIQGVIIGWGDDARRYFVSGVQKITSIQEAEKNIGPSHILVYRGYNMSGNLAFEIEAGSGLTIKYFEE